MEANVPFVLAHLVDERPSFTNDGIRSLFGT